MPAAAKYREIADGLRSQIDAGDLAVGDRLPTEQALVERYNASRSTVRQALQELRDAGLIEIRHGVGAFVLPPRLVRRLDNRERLSRARRQRNEGAFLAEAADQGFTPSSNVRVWFETADDFAEIFEIAETDEVCVRDRVMRADGQPVMLAVSRLPREISRGTALEQVDTGPGGIFARLEEMGYELTEHEEIVRARMPDADERRLLDIPSGPVLCVQRRTYSHGRVVEVNDMTMPATRYELRYAWAAE
jgi:GntR family transcriptional regulator